MALGEALQLENTAAQNWECQAVSKIHKTCDKERRNGLLCYKSYVLAFTVI